ncbi:coiled-coil domain-containing protein [Campylobacter coli]
MSEKLNVVCIGNCDLYPTYGFVGGLRESGAKVVSYGESINTVHSFLYHIERSENQNTIYNANLIVLGIGGGSNDRALIPLYKILYKKLWKFNKKIVVCIWLHSNLNELEKFHYAQCETYGFNLIDTVRYCKEKGIFDFYTGYYDYGHPFYSFMSGISKRIIGEYEKLQYPKQLSNAIDDADFKIVSFVEFVNGDAIKKVRTFTHYENIYVLQNGQEVKIPSKYEGYTLIGIHTFNGAVYKYIRPKVFTTFVLKNKSKKALVYAVGYNCVAPINAKYFIIDNETFLERIFDDTIEKLKPIIRNEQIVKDANLGLIALLLIKDNKCLGNYEIDYDENFKLSSKYDFSYLLDFLIEGKNFIEDYNKRQDPKKLAPLQTQLQEKDQIIQTKNQELESKTQELTQTKNQLDSTKQQLDSKVKELTSKTKELSSLPIKKQTLEIKNLEQDNLLKQIQIQEAKQDLINKQLHTKQLEKELGYESNVLKELELNKQELIQTKNQLDFTKKQLESKNKILSSNPNPSHFIQNTSCFKGKLAYLNTLTTAKSRIHNHLSYKLGQAMITNSKSLLGYIRMPFVLSYIKDKHKQEQKNYQEKIKKDPSLKLPPLENYPDYKEALKEKECLTYKLGEALIKANKTWYKGGYVKMWFEIGKLKKGFKKK